MEEVLLAAYSDDSEEESIFHVGCTEQIKNIDKVDQITNVNVDYEAWKLEVEHVLPHLKVTIKSDNRDWRSHFQLMNTHRMKIRESLATTRQSLDRAQKEITRTLEKISNRERYLNKELDFLLSEYQSLQEQLSKVKDTYSNISNGVNERTRNLSTFTEKLESTKHQMEKLGISMTDGSKFETVSWIIKTCVVLQLLW